MAAAGHRRRARRARSTRAIGPHRRFAWVEGDLDRFKAIKGALGGTVNDVVLDRRGRRAARAPGAARPRARRASS